jgi:hypothetical protein
MKLETLDWISARVCPVINLARRLIITFFDGKRELLDIEASG